MSRWKPWAWVAGLLALGGVLSPPFWSGVGGTARLVAAVVLLTAVRELVRLGVGCAMGLRPTIIELGEAMPLARFRTGRLLWIIHRRPIGSATHWEPPAPDTPVRARLAIATLARSAVAGAVLLAAHAAHVPLGWSSEGGGPVWRALVMAAEALLIVGLVPFTIRGQSIVPFESDGMKLTNLLFGRGGPGAAFGHSYFAMVREALNDGDAARALAICHEGQKQVTGPWLDVLQGMEAMARGRSGDYTAAMAKREAALATELQPVARAVALNDWSWYAFLEGDDRKRRLADRRSAQAMVLKPDLGPVAGTRGAVLLWQGRLAEALPLLERAVDTSQTRRGRETDLCLLAIATAGGGDLARARQALAGVTRAAETEGLFQRAQSAIDAAGQARLTAQRGRRALVIAEHGLELHEAHRVRPLPAGDIRRVEIGLTARGRAHVLIVTDRYAWRLPLAPAELTWARSLLSRVVASELRPEPTVAAAEGTESLETQERAYQERARGMSGAVSTPQGVLFLVSMVAFAASMMWLSSSWQWVGMLLPILFVHELGHWIAMRVFGHDDAKIAFIPLMGAATMTRIPFQKRWQEIVMLLAGPVPGMVAGILLLVLPATRHMPRVHSLAITAVSINFLNLLPLHPLDGGRILHALVTAGRPRLDLAFKTVAELLFLWGGFRLHDPVLTMLGVMGLVFWPHARRASGLERRIRATPGFDPRLPPKERRAYIFRALAHEPALKGKDWASTVTTLEGPLGYQPLAGWKIAVGGVAVALFAGGGMTAASVWFMKRMPRQLECPVRTTARPLSCSETAQPASVDWRVPTTQAVAPGDDDDEPHLAGFVWCATAEKAGADNLFTDLNQMQAAREFCAAYPWELAGGITAEQKRARETLSHLSRLRYIKDESRWNLAVEQRRSAPWFDEKTAQLLRQLQTADAKAYVALYEALSQRLGPAPGRRCGTITIHNVRRLDATASDNDLAFSVTMNEPADFAPMQAFLCRAGCTLSVLPAAPDDRRIGYCR